MKSIRQAPGPRATSLFGLLRGLSKDRLAFFERMWREYGEVVRIPLANKPLVMLTNPEHLEYVLRKNYLNFRKAELFNKERKTGLGLNLLTTEGAHWLKQRKLAQPAFKRQALAQLVDDMVAVGTRDLDGWAPHLDGEPFDVAPELTAIAINIASKTLFGVDMRPDTAKVREAVGVIVRDGSARMASVFRLPWAVPTPRTLRIKRALRQLDEVVYGVIRDRRAEEQAAGDAPERDVLTRLLRARDPESGESMSDQELRNEVVTFLIAGHESAASSMAWTAWLLGRHPEVEAKVRAEVEAVLGGAPPTAETLPQLELTRRVVLESLRLYPPSWLFDRESIEADTLGDYAIPPRTVFCIVPYVQHRDPTYWPDPERFDPDRFLPEAVKARPTFSYCPFGGGPRRCIGDEFALMEMTIVVALTLQRYRLTLVEDHPVETLPAIALRPLHGVKVRLSAAEGSPVTA